MSPTGRPSGGSKRKQGSAPAVADPQIASTVPVSGVSGSDASLDDGVLSGVVRAKVRGGDRRHLRPSRPYSVFARFSEDEWVKLVSAGERAGLTTTGFVAEAGVRAASGGRLEGVLEYRDALKELIAARGEVRRLGVLVNQAIVAGHVRGVGVAVLVRLVERADRVVAGLDRAAGVVVERLP